MNADRIEIEVSSDGPARTRAIARLLGALLAGGEVLALTGPLGAGKTAFVKGVGEGMGIDPREVTSPTFLLIHEIEGPRPLCHADAYRVKSGEELREEGIAERMGGDWVTAIEWAERAPDVLPADRLEVEIEPLSEETRTIRFRGVGARHARLLARLAEALA